MLKILLAAIWLFLLSCSSTPQGTTARIQNAGTAAASSDLLWTEAQERKLRLSNINYEVKVDLTGDSDQYSADYSVQFDLKDNDKDLRLDFFEGQVKDIKLNDQQLSASVKKPYWIELPASALKVGTNRLTLGYSQKYSKIGQGLHRFKDPEDGQYYLYSQFQPYYANRFLPSFDQPDLRATIKMQVTVPKGWQVITATRETAKMAAVGQPTGGGYISEARGSAMRGARGKITRPSTEAELWDFPKSPAIATYLFSLHAGPYKVFSDTYVNKGSRIPLRIFIRPAMAKYLDVNEWFTITKQGFKFFENYFAINYPFQKYDQLIVPESNFSGMENLAAVTYTEQVISRSKPTRNGRRSIANLMLHEMAHMWFGDLVTMAWWNDLWLNESFATLMASVAVDQATEFKDEWQNFAANVKRGAYIQDALTETTHPIEVEVTRVKQALSIFDGITYNKGAAVMKQLRYFMTDEAFQKGIRQYMKKHAYQNTTLNDFIASLQAETKKDLSLWAERWLRQSGTDQVAATWTCQGNRLNQITVTMTPSTGAQFRPQSFELGLYQRKGNQVKIQNKVRADLLSPEPKVIKGSWACPDFLYPNQGDHAYANVVLDQRSLELLTNHLSGVQDVLVRSLIWNDLWRMVRSSELPLKTYIAIVENNFSRETDEIILTQVVGSIGRSGGSVLAYWPDTTPEAVQARREFLNKMETDFIARLKKSESGSDIEKFWFDSLVRIGETPVALDATFAALQAGRVSPQFELDLDRKWGIVRQLTRFQHPQAQASLATLKKLDVSDRGLKSALSVDAVTPSLDVKRKWISEFTGRSNSRPLEELQIVAYSLFPNEQKQLQTQFESTFIDYFKKNKNSEDEKRVATVVYGLMPLRCQAQASEKVKSLIESDKDMNPGLLKNLKMSLQEDERCQKIRQSF